jgi:hypothetical protein
MVRARPRDRRGVAGRTRLPIVLAGFWASLGTVAAVATVVSQPKWWTWIAPEASLAREINTGMLLATSALALLIWRRRLPSKPLPMLLVSVGFFLLAVDERVAVHERMRDRILAPRGVNLPFVPWAEPGDVVLVVVAIIGLALLRPVLRVVAVDRRALRWFGIGVVLAAVAVGLDTLPIETYQLRYEIYFQSGEEAIELIAAACFLSSMACLWEHTAERVEAVPSGLEPPVGAQNGLHHEDSVTAR